MVPDPTPLERSWFMCVPWSRYRHLTLFGTRHNSMQRKITRMGCVHVERIDQAERQGIHCRSTDAKLCLVLGSTTPYPLRSPLA